MSENSTYQRIARELETRIRDNRPGYQPGDRIPGEDTIAEEFHVARGTARQAVEQLRRAAYVQSRHRAGTYVRHVLPVRRLTTNRFNEDVREADGARGAYDNEMRALGLAGTTRWLHLGPKPCPDNDALGRGQDTSATLLQVEPETMVMVRARHMLAAPIAADGTVNARQEETLQVATSYIPWDLAILNPRLISEDSGVGGIYSRLRDAGHRVVRAREYHGERVGTDEECRLLGLDQVSIVKWIDRQAFDAEGRVVEICRHVVAPGLFVTVNEFPIT